jgi:hypothetical protein
MAEISQTTPIKPIWPDRREQRPKKKDQDENSSEKKKGPRSNRDGEAGRGPATKIDDYA